jgi:surface protein
LNSKKIIILIVSLFNLKCEDKLDYKSKNQLTEKTELNYTNPKIYLDDNKVTVKCPEAIIGSKGTINGEEYTVINEEKLRDMISKGETVQFVCTSKINNMSSLIQNKEKFNQDISSWDTSNVTNMRRMFFYALNFNKSIELWDTSNVKDMRGMFTYAYSFNQDIGRWEVSNVNSMSSMFEYSESFNQNLSNWCVSNIKFEPEFFSVSSRLEKKNNPIWGTCPY